MNNYKIKNSHPSEYGFSDYNNFEKRWHSARYNIISM